MGALDTWSDIYVWMGTEKYKWKMTDKPHVIAKKFRFKKFDTIWIDASNKKLKSSRKKPENIKKGDVLVIPPTPSDRAKIKADIIARATESIAYNHEYSKVQANIADKMEMASKSLSNILKSQQIMFRNADYLLKDARANMKKWADGVDLAKDLIDMTRGLTKLAIDTKNSTKLSGGELKALNSEIANEAVGMVGKSVKMLVDTTKLSLAPKIDKAANYKGMRAEDRALKDTAHSFMKLRSDIEKFGSLMNKAYDDIQKPSFVALAYTSLREGKSWSESVTRDVDDELKQMRLRNKVIILKSMGETSRRKKWVDEQAKLYRGLAKVSLQQAKAYEKNLASYKKL